MVRKVNQCEQNGKCIRKYEEKYRLLFENIMEGVICRDASGKIIAANLPAQKILGLTLEQMLGLTFVPCWHSIDIDSSDFPVEQHPAMVALSTGKPVDNILMNIFNSKEETFRWININAIPLFKPGSTEPYEVYSIFQDVTEYKQSIENLIKSRAQVTTILESITDGFLAVDNEWQVTYINKAAEQLMLKPCKKIIGKNFWNEFPQFPESSFFINIKKALQDKIAIQYDGFYSPLNKWLKIHIYPSAVGLSIYLQDITERKITEQELRLREREFKALVDNAPDVIARVDNNLRYLYANPVIEFFTNIPACMFLGKNHAELGLSENYSSNLDKELRKVFKTGQSSTVEFTLTTGQKTLYFHAQLMPELSDDGTVASVLRITRDITAQKQLEKEMARFDRLNLVGEMAVGIGHEIRNPLTSVRGFLQLLSIKKDCAQYASYFSTMIEELDRANSIITEFLSLAKNKTISLQKHCLNKIVEAIAPLIQADAIVNDKYLITNLTDIPCILIDEKEIRQLILNLARNGLEAMAPGGTLQINTFHDNQSVVLAIQDEGTGIPSDIVDKLGTPFFSTKDHGTGLGLAVCYSIAARHKAVLEVSTSSSGTTFYIRFKV